MPTLCIYRGGLWKITASIIFDTYLRFTKYCLLTLNRRHPRPERRQHGTVRTKTRPHWDIIQYAEDLHGRKLRRIVEPSARAATSGPAALSPSVSATKGRRPGREWPKPHKTLDQYAVAAAVLIWVSNQTGSVSHCSMVGWGVGWDRCYRGEEGAHAYGIDTVRVSSYGRNSDQVHTLCLCLQKTQLTFIQLFNIQVGVCSSEVFFTDSSIAGGTKKGS